MVSLRVQICSLLVLVYATFLGQINCEGLSGRSVALFAFGDSHFEPGNNNYINTTNDYRANFWPYGLSFFKYPTGRLCDGRLIPDFIAQYAGLPIPPTFLQPGKKNFIYGANFASAGSGALVETHRGFTISLKTQVLYFKQVAQTLKRQLGDAQAKKLLSNAVYLISIGANDYMTRDPSIPDEKFTAMVLGNITVAVQDIYKIGGRKFGFPGMPPWGCSPVFLMFGNGSCAEEVNRICKLHQNELGKTLLSLQLPDLKFSVYDFYTAMTKRLNNPSNYGFKDAKSGCCGSGPYRGAYTCGGKRGDPKYELCNNLGEHLYFDSYHPTQKAFQQFATEMWSGGYDVIWPYNIKQLFQAGLSIATIVPPRDVVESY